MESRDNTLKVGLIVVAAIILAVIGYTVLQDVLIARDNVTYYALFETSRGAQSGTVVELDGNAIGKVVDFELMPAGRGSRVTLRIERDVPLFAEYEFVIAQDDLFGEKYINIVDTMTDRNLASSQPVEPEFEFTGRNRSGIGNMLASAITETLTQASDAMGTDEIRANIDRISAGMITTLDNVNKLVVSINEVVGGSEGLVTGSLANVYAMSENFRAMSEELSLTSKELSGIARDPAQRERWDRMLVNAEETSANLARLSASLDSLAGDPALQQDIKDTVRLTKETLEETKNTVVQFQGTLDRTEELMDSADSLMGDAGEAIGEARQKMDQLSNVGDAVEIKMGLNVRAVDQNDDRQLNNDDIYVGDLNAAVGYEDTYVYFGADNIGEDNNFNLMMGYGSLAGFSFRGGVYRGELGLGAAYYGDLGAEVTWYDTEDPKVNAYGYIPIADQLNLVVGGEDLGNDPVASVGIGVDLE